MKEPTSRGSETSGATDRSSAAQPREVSFLRLVTILMRHRRAVLLCSFLGVLFAVGLTILAAPSFTARTTFLPQGDRPSLQGLANVATQLGIQIPTAVQGGGQSPAFYAELLRSRELRRATVETSYTFRLAGGDTVEGDLVEILDSEGPGRGERVAKAIRQLEDMTEITTATETGVVQLGVTTRWAVLSQKVGARMLELVNKFNLETRRSQAGAEREFLAERVEAARRDLRAAEDSLKSFLVHNRQYENSPSLRFEYERLRRRVSLQQQVYTTLATSFEQAKMEEVRDTPVITVVDPPEVPAIPDPSRLPLKTILGLLVGGLLGMGWALGSEMMRTSRREEPVTYTQFEEAWADTRDEFRRLLDRIRRRS